MKRISLDSSHIEHFWPKTFFPQIDLDYNNMFASCNGDGIIGIDGHCGHKKEDWWEIGRASCRERVYVSV